jgi:hypothetical protein
MKPLDEPPRCPNCASEMSLTSKERHEDGTYMNLKYECDFCHVLMKITTRNNRRIDMALVFGVYVGMISFAFGVLVQTILLLRK